MSVTFSNILAKQIQRQKYLLDKEARKEERRRRNYRKKNQDQEQSLEVVDVPPVFQIDNEIARRKESDNKQAPKKESASASRKSSADFLDTSPLPQPSTSQPPKEPKEYRKKTSAANLQHRPLGEHARKKQVSPKRRGRASSADPNKQGLLNEQPKKRKRRTKSQEPNIGLENTGRKVSDELDKLQMENRVNQEIERAQTPINP